MQSTGAWRQIYSNAEEVSARHHGNHHGQSQHKAGTNVATVSVKGINQSEELLTMSSRIKLVLNVVVCMGLAVAYGNTLDAESETLATQDSPISTESEESPDANEDLETPELSDPILPRLLEVVPSVPQTGDRLELLFPESTYRGGYFTLEQRDGTEWTISHYLISDKDANGPMIFTEDPCCDEYSVGGPGPDLVDLPDVMKPGEWRICAQNAVDEICGSFTIE